MIKKEGEYVKLIRDVWYSAWDKRKYSTKYTIKIVGDTVIPSKSGELTWAVMLPYGRVSEFFLYDNYSYELLPIELAKECELRWQASPLRGMDGRKDDEDYGRTEETTW